MASNPISTALQQVERNLANLASAFKRAMQGRRGNALAQTALAKLRQEPPAPNYPIRWKTERQRRAFFASDGFGRGIPASRSRPSKVAQGWAAEFIPTDDGGILALTNPVPYMQFVQGINAQPFHLDTGWVQLEDVVSDFFREAEDAAVAVWFDSADPLEGV